MLGARGALADCGLDDSIVELDSIDGRNSALLVVKADIPDFSTTLGGSSLCGDLEKLKEGEVWESKTEKAAERAVTQRATPSRQAAERLLVRQSSQFPAVVTQRLSTQRLSTQRLSTQRLSIDGRTTVEVQVQRAEVQVIELLT